MFYMYSKTSTKQPRSGFDSCNNNISDEVIFIELIFENFTETHMCTYYMYVIFILKI